MSNLPDRLREVMRELNLSKPTDLANFCNVSEGLVSQWFSGTTKLGPKPLKAFARTRFSLDWLTEGKLPKYRMSGSATTSHDSEKESDNDFQIPTSDDYEIIPQLDLQASCGNGKFNDYVVVKGGLSFKRETLQAWGITPKNGRVIYASGQSMEPTIGHGRVVLINMDDTELQDGRVYLICDCDSAMFLKRMVREFDPAAGGMTWKMRSDNPDKRQHADKPLPDASMASVVGRAVWHDGVL